MQIFNVIFERLPMVWFLLGLLFVATGLYVGFDNSLVFAYMIAGLACSAYGMAITVFRFWERPTSSAEKRLSPGFISVGSTVIMPAMSNAESGQENK